ncbi:MAG: 3'-5' exonuclease [Clostridia bacterium]|nr:3'-5' exonuclease [Clostridia bacterium]
MIREHKGSSKIELVNSYIVLDIETTGLDLVYDEIIEIGALKVVNGQIVETFSELVRPNNKISQFISSLTGITNEMLDSAQEIDKVLPRFIDFAQNMLIVGHNVNFDINFIYDYTLNVLNKPFANNFIDTLRLSRKIFNNLKTIDYRQLASL